MRSGVVGTAAVGIDGWGQAMRTKAGCIVEVHGDTDADIAQRVYRAIHGHDPQRLDARYELGPVDVFPAFLVAELLSSWLHGALPLGFDRELRHVSPGEQRRYELLA